MLTKTRMKGQFTIVSLVMTLVMIIVYSQLYPVIENFLTPLVVQLNAAGDPATATLINLIPFFIAIAIIMSVIWYIVPQKR